MSVTFTIDGKTITVEQGTTVYQAAKRLGVELPIFCYQDRMPPFGACRVCLVEVEKMPKLQTSCTLVATDGMVVKTQSQMAVEGREGIIEFLLINHPLDCPICDRGGECPLQEQTLKFGTGESRFFEDKRHFTKAKPLGPVLMLDRERCIVCARCTRFSEIVSKDNALEFIDRGFRTEVGTPDGAPVESKFIGNTIMICPVGALTSDVYRFRARPWDNDSTNSTCTLCPVGCSLILDTRDGEIMRTRSREDKNVNDIWMCDKGWFGYEFSSSENRLTHPLIRRGESLSQSSWSEAIDFIAQKFNLAKESGKLAAWGGNPLTVEENYLFQRLFRERGGVDHVDHRIGEPLFTLEEEGLPAGMDINLKDVEDLNSVYLLGVDLTEEFPVIWLRLSQAINKGAKVSFIGHFGTEISRHLNKVVIHEPGKELEHLSNLMFEGKSAIFIGKQYLSSPARRAILSFIKEKYPQISLNILEGRGNGIGARWAGMRPDLGPMGRPLVKGGLNPEQVVDKALSDGWDLLYVAGANPANKFPASKWKDFRSKLGCLVVQDIFLTETAKNADVVLPALSFVEKGGSFINIEGRVQTLMPAKISNENVFSDYDIFLKVAQKLNFPLKVDSGLTNQLSQPKITISRPDKIMKGSVPEAPDLSLSFAVKLFDDGVRMRESPHVHELAKKPFARMNENEANKRGIKNGQIIKISAGGNIIKAPVAIDNKVADKVLVLPLGFNEVPVHEFGTSLLNGMRGEIHV